MSILEYIKTYIFVLNKSLEITSSRNNSNLGVNITNLIEKEDIKKLEEVLKDTDRRAFPIKMQIEEKVKKYRIDIQDNGNEYILVATEINPINDLILSLRTLKRYALTDHLTGALNRHAYWLFLKRALLRASREEQDIGIVFVDIDYLKAINTHKGYESGDLAISNVAKKIKNVARETDLVVRLGGDEFLIVFPIHTDKTFTVEDMCRRILERVRKIEGEKVSTTVSLGGQVMQIDDVKNFVGIKEWEKEWKKISKIADEYAAEAKKCGKNRAIVDGKLIC